MSRTPSAVRSGIYSERPGLSNSSLETHEYAQRVGMIMQEVDAMRKGLAYIQAEQAEGRMSQ